MSKTAFKCDGEFQMGRLRQHFSIEIVAESEDAARVGLYSELGSRHGVPRRQVDLQSVVALKADEATDITRKKLE